MPVAGFTPARKRADSCLDGDVTELARSVTELSPLVRAGILRVF